jgi:dTDP-4-amino-4,6-dideoxygalactose transaminase
MGLVHPSMHVQRQHILRPMLNKQGQESIAARGLQQMHRFMNNVKRHRALKKSVKSRLRGRKRTMLKTTPPPIKKPSRRAVQRAVASSTAVETGRSVAQLEQSLRQAPSVRFAHIKLAR